MSRSGSIFAHSLGTHASASFTCAPTRPPTRMRRSSCGAAPGSSPIRRSISPRGSTGGGSAGATSWSRPPPSRWPKPTARLVGFVTVDPRTFDLDQIVVAPEAWGSGIASALIAEAKRLSPQRPRPARQHGQCARHPLLREAWLYDLRRGDQLALGRAGPQDELAAVPAASRTGRVAPGRRTARPDRLSTSSSPLSSIHFAR